MTAGKGGEAAGKRNKVALPDAVQQNSCEQQQQGRQSSQHPQQEQQHEVAASNVAYVQDEAEVDVCFSEQHHTQEQQPQREAAAEQPHGNNSRSRCQHTPQSMEVASVPNDIIRGDVKVCEHPANQRHPALEKQGVDGGDCRSKRPPCNKKVVLPAAATHADPATSPPSSRMPDTLAAASCSAHRRGHHHPMYICHGQGNVCSATYSSTHAILGMPPDVYTSRATANNIRVRSSTSHSKDMQPSPNFSAATKNRDDCMVFSRHWHGQTDDVHKGAAGCLVWSAGQSDPAKRSNVKHKARCSMSVCKAGTKPDVSQKHRKHHTMVLEYIGLVRSNVRCCFALATAHGKQPSCKQMNCCMLEPIETDKLCSDASGSQCMTAYLSMISTCFLCCCCSPWQTWKSWCKI